MEMNLSLGSIVYDVVAFSDKDKEDLINSIKKAEPYNFLPGMKDEDYELINTIKNTDDIILIDLYNSKLNHGLAEYFGYLSGNDPADIFVNIIAHGDEIVNDDGYIMNIIAIKINADTNINTRYYVIDYNDLDDIGYYTVIKPKEELAKNDIEKLKQEITTLNKNIDEIKKTLEIIMTKPFMKNYAKEFKEINGITVEGFNKQLDATKICQDFNG